MAAVIVQIFNPIEQLEIINEIATKKSKAEFEIHPVTAKPKIRKCSI